jgi:hypothetical protein
MSDERALGDVSIDGRWIGLECCHCLHRDSRPAWKFVGWPELMLKAFRAALRCSKCKKNRIEVVELLWCEEMEKR